MAMASIVFNFLFLGVLKPFGFLKGDQLVCHSHGWLSPRHVLVATEHGKILLFEDAELKSSYSMEELTRTSAVIRSIGCTIGFNQEKALAEAFSVTVKTDGSFYSTNQDRGP